MSTDLNLGVQFPGEGLAIAVVEAWSKGRDNMSQANRDQWDAILLLFPKWIVEQLNKAAK